MFCGPARSIPHSLHPLDAAQEVCLLVKDVAGMDCRPPDGKFLWSSLPLTWATVDGLLVVYIPVVFICL